MRYAPTTEWHAEEEGYPTGYFLIVLLNEDNTVAIDEAFKRFGEVGSGVVYDDQGIMDGHIYWVPLDIELDLDCARSVSHLAAEAYIHKKLRGSLNWVLSQDVQAELDLNRAIEHNIEYQRFSRRQRFWFNVTLLLLLATIALMLFIRYVR